MDMYLKDVNPEDLKAQVSKKVQDIIDILRLKEVIPPVHIDETPERISKMFVDELFSSCYHEPPQMKIFKDPNNTPVLSTNIGISSCCSHHGVPFYGVASIYYVPKDGVITGLSKFYRVCEYFSRRPQVQEQLTKQIGEYIFNELNPHQLIVTMKCKHMCVCHRGAKAHNPWTITHWEKSDSEYPITWDQIQYVISTLEDE